MYGMVGSYYHPMVALGDRFSAYRTGAISIPIVVALTMLMFQFRRRPIAPVYNFFGSILLVAAVAVTFLPRVESGYEQVYWIENHRHSIPWTFGPYNGDPQRGGRYFLVRAWGEALAPYYEHSGQQPKDHFILGKSSAFNYGKGGPPPEDNCVVGKYNFRCEWQNGNYVYAMSIKAQSAPTNPQSLFRSVEELLNSFAVDEE
ncbi:MAG: hypothetical protein AAGA38_08170 [Pseudomonadota bacterium]